VQGLKSFSKSRLLKKRDIFRTPAGMKVVTALDKVQSEILVMSALGQHDSIVQLSEVITETTKDELYLGKVTCTFGCRHVQIQRICVQCWNTLMLAS
jgi:hypothetical protein